MHLHCVGVDTRINVGAESVERSTIEHDREIGLRFYAGRTSVEGGRITYVGW